MAYGTVFTLDNPRVIMWWVDAAGDAVSRFDYSEFATRIHLLVRRQLVEAGFTGGWPVPLRGLSRKYDWSITLDLVSDRHPLGGINLLSDHIRELLPPPMGRGDGRAMISVEPEAITLPADRAPTYEGPVWIPSWEPMGAGQVGQPVVHRLTLPAAGTLTVRYAHDPQG